MESLQLAMSQDQIILELPFPALQFAAKTLESCILINFLMGKYENFILKMTANEDGIFFFILPRETKTEKITEVIDRIGYACVFYWGDEGRRYAYT